MEKISEARIEQAQQTFKPILTIHDVRKALQDRRLKVVANRIGVAYQTLLRISKGETTKPQYEVMLRLIAYLETN